MMCSNLVEEYLFDLNNMS